MDRGQDDVVLAGLFAVLVGIFDDQVGQEGVEVAVAGGDLLELLQPGLAARVIVSWSRLEVIERNSPSGRVGLSVLNFSRNWLIERSNAGAPVSRYGATAVDVSADSTA